MARDFSILRTKLEHSWPTSVPPSLSCPGCTIGRGGQKNPPKKDGVVSIRILRDGAAPTLITLPTRRPRYCVPCADRRRRRRRPSIFCSAGCAAPPSSRRCGGGRLSHRLPTNFTIRRATVISTGSRVRHRSMKARKTCATHRNMRCSVRHRRRPHGTAHVAWMSHTWMGHAGGAAVPGLGANGIHALLAMADRTELLSEF